MAQTKYTDGSGVAEIWTNIKNYITAQLLGKSNTGHTHVKSEITDFPTIPTKTSDLTNDSGFLTSHQDLSGYVPRSGGAVLNGQFYARNTDNSKLVMCGASTDNNGAYIAVHGKNYGDTSYAGSVYILANNSSNICSMLLKPDGTAKWGNKNFAMQEDVIPRSGGAVMTGLSLSKTNDDEFLEYNGGSGWHHGASISLRGKDCNTYGDAGCFLIQASDGTNDKVFVGRPNGTLTWNGKNIAMQENVIPRSGGAVMTGDLLASSTINSIGFGYGWGRGGTIYTYSPTHNTVEWQGSIRLEPLKTTSYFKTMQLKPDGTWTWNGTACQITSDQRLKQQITEIDDKLLDAWEDVELSQFKYNDAVEQKGKDKARLHTGFVVQQIDSACKKHGVDISTYGLYCHEVYPEEVEEVEIEQADGTKTKETKVIREASEHYSLRYTEALIVECKYLRRCVERLTARIEELEKGNNSK